MSVGRGFHLPDYKHQSSYGEIPLDNWLKLGLVKQQEDEKTLDEEDKINQSLLSLKSIDQDKGQAKELVNSYLGELNNWHNKYKDNLSAGSQELRSLKNKLMMDQTQGKWSAIQNKYAGEQQMIKEAQEAAKKHRDSGGKEGTDPEFVNEILNYAKTNQEVTHELAPGVFDNYKAQPILATPNLTLMNQEAVSKMKPSEIAEKSGWTKTKDGQRWIQNGAKIEELPEHVITNGLTGLHLTNPAVKSYFDYKNKIRGIQPLINQAQEQIKNNGYTSFDQNGNPVFNKPMLSKEELMYQTYPEIFNTAKAAGEAFNYSKRESDQGMKFDPYSLSDYNNQPFDSTPHLDTGSYDASLSPVVNNSKGWFDNNGNLLQKKTNQISTVKPRGGAYEGVLDASNPSEINSNKGVTQINKNYQSTKDLISNIRQRCPNITKNMNDKDVLDFYTNTLNTSGKISFNSYDLNGLDIGKLNSHIMTNLSGKKVMLTGDLESTTLPSVAQKLSLPSDELEKRIQTAKTNGIKPASTNNPGSWKVTVIGGDNLPYEITVEGDKDQQNFFQEYDALLKYDKEGAIGDVITNNFYSTTNIQENGNNANYGTIIYPLSSGTVTKKQIEDKFGTLQDAETQGNKFVKVGDKYKLVLTQQATDPVEFGRALVKQWNSIGLRNYQEKRNDKPTYQMNEE